ncbi:MAG TPA: DinB family protein [Acidobacteriaceae bacterium]|nr:DinB family protein [Acidobacteriaceae bacterium]
MTEQAKTAPELTGRPPLPEPWLRGTLTGIPPVARAVLHSLELAREDVIKWCAGLDQEELDAWPLGLPSAAFQLRHIARSLDRFVSYAEGRALNERQLADLASEKEPGESKEEVFREFELGLSMAGQWLLETLGQPAERPVKIGRKGLSTTFGGLLVHMAEHTQRHVGQAVTTAKVVMAQRTAGGS